MPSVGTFASNIARMQALYRFILALGWGGELEGEHHASLSGVGGPGWCRRPRSGVGGSGLGAGGAAVSTLAPLSSTGGLGTGVGSWRDSTRNQGPYLNAVFGANICGPACFKNAKTCGKNAAKKANYAAKNCTYAVIMRIQNQIVRLCCYGAANWRALKVKRWSRVKIAACNKLLVS